MSQDLFLARVLVMLADQAEGTLHRRLTGGTEVAEAGIALAQARVNDICPKSLHLLRLSPKRGLLGAFWAQYLSQVKPAHPAVFRITVNRPAGYLAQADREFHVEPSWSSAVCHVPQLALLGIKGSLGTRQADDVTVFHEEGIDDSSLEELATYLGPGSTVTLIRPGAAHQFWLSWLECPVTRRLVTILEREFKLTPLFADGTPETFEHNVYTLEAKTAQTNTGLERTRGGPSAPAPQSKVRHPA